MDSERPVYQLVLRLIARDLRARYKVAVLGFFWSLLKPLAYWVVLFTVFGVLLGDMRQSLVGYQGQVSFGIWLMVGLFCWMFFSQAVMDAAGSILGHSHLVTRVALPRWVLPTSAVGANLVNFAMTLVVMILVLLAFGVWPRPAWALLPVVLLIQTALALAVGLLAAVLIVVFRDIGMILDVVLMAWFYLTPIFYPLRLVGSGGNWVLTAYLLNPMAGIIYSYQRLFFGGADVAALSRLGWGLALGWSAVATLLLLGLARLVYRRFNPTLVDYI